MTVHKPTPPEKPVRVLANPWSKGHIAGTFEHLYRWSLTTEERERLGFAPCGHDECLSNADMARDCAASKGAA